MALLSETTILQGVSGNQYGIKTLTIMHFIKHLFILSILFFCTNSLSAQSVKSIEGRVLDQQTQQPLTGAIIMIPGTTYGTTTNKEGYFKLTPKQRVDTLRITYIGYRDQVITVPNNHGFLRI